MPQDNLMEKIPEQVALIDMDGTLADFDGQMQRDLDAMRSPDEPPFITGPQDDLPYIEARKNAIKKQPGWWLNLPELTDGFRILHELRLLGFSLMILTKGPFKTTSAWSEKVDWCRTHVPDAKVTISEDKGLVYGKLLVDDWPPYCLRWLEWRPRGLVIMPDRAWNQGVTHPNIFRYTGTEENHKELVQRLKKIAKVKSED